jgi:hypothetical protein
MQPLGAARHTGAAAGHLYMTAAAAQRETFTMQVGFVRNMRPSLGSVAEKSALSPHAASGCSEAAGTPVQMLGTCIYMTAAAAGVATA